MGWRSWLVVEEAEGPRLSSVVYPTVWPLRCELVGVCQRRRQLRRWLTAEVPHPAPGEGCQCGIYAASDPTRLRPYLTGHAADARSSGRLIGRVAGRVLLWGTVVECEHGWRASCAYPERIYLHSGSDWPLDADRLSEALASYGVPVERVACGTPGELVEALSREAEAA